MKAVWWTDMPEESPDPFDDDATEWEERAELVTLVADALAFWHWQVMDSDLTDEDSWREVADAVVDALRQNDPRQAINVATIAVPPIWSG